MPESTQGDAEPRSDTLAERVIAHIDMDCFYVQCEVLRDPSLRGLPVAVVQYDNTARVVKDLAPGDKRRNIGTGSAIIAVSYEARAAGVTRQMRAHEARRVCRRLQLVQVPTRFGKPDLTMYREAGAKVMGVLQRRAAICEKASIDEAYVDITQEAERLRAKTVSAALVAALLDLAQGTRIAGIQGDSSAFWHQAISAAQGGDSGAALWVCAAAVVSEIRTDVWRELGFTCSSGIYSNKLVAKLLSSLHKPNLQSMCLPGQYLEAFLGPLAIGKLRSLGGKYGDDVAHQLGVQTVRELASVPRQQLAEVFGEQGGEGLWLLAHGICDEPVQKRAGPKTILCNKTFLGREAIVTLPALQLCLHQLGAELDERMRAEVQVLGLEAGRIVVGLRLEAPTTGLTSLPLEPGPTGESAFAGAKSWLIGRPFRVIGLSLTASRFDTSAGLERPAKWLKTFKPQELPQGAVVHNAAQIPTPLRFDPVTGKPRDHISRGSPELPLCEAGAEYSMANSDAKSMCRKRTLDQKPPSIKKLLCAAGSRDAPKLRPWISDKDAIVTIEL